METYFLIFIFSDQPLEQKVDECVCWSEEYQKKKNKMTTAKANNCKGK